MPIIISRQAQEFGREVGANDCFELVDIECGLHSGIPKCCVLFFVKVWRHWMDEREGVLMNSYWSTQRVLGINQPGYIPCPACLLAGNLVPIKECFCYRQRSIKLA
jgi:hypothetical protein